MAPQLIKRPERKKKNNNNNKKRGLIIDENLKLELGLEVMNDTFGKWGLGECGREERKEGEKEKERRHGLVSEGMEQREI